MTSEVLLTEREVSKMRVELAKLSVGGASLDSSFCSVLGLCGAVRSSEELSKLVLVAAVSGSRERVSEDVFPL